VKAYTEDDIKTILEMHREGAMLVPIAKKVGRSPQSVHKVIKRHAVVPEETLAADVRRKLLKQFTTKTISKMPMREQLIADF
jgi:IS30 family transposase